MILIIEYFYRQQVGLISDLLLFGVVGYAIGFGRYVFALRCYYASQIACTEVFCTSYLEADCSKYLPCSFHSAVLKLLG